MASQRLSSKISLGTSAASDVRFFVKLYARCSKVQNKEKTLVYLKPKNKESIKLVENMQKCLLLGIYIFMNVLPSSLCLNYTFSVPPTLITLNSAAPSPCPLLLILHFLLHFLPYLHNTYYVIYIFRFNFLLSLPPHTHQNVNSTSARIFLFCSLMYPKCLNST